MCTDKEKEHSMTDRATCTILIAAIGFLLGLYMTSCMGKLSKIQVDISAVQVQVAALQCKMMTRGDVQQIAIEEVRKFMYEKQSKEIEKCRKQ